MHRKICGLFVDEIKSSCPQHHPGLEVLMSPVPMTIWTVCDGEPLPIDDDVTRLLRTAILSKLLASRGHAVVYWTSRFDHLRKRLRMEKPSRVDSGQGYKIDCVDCVPYKSNVSMNRLKHNRMVARDMLARMRADLNRPDIMVTDLPTLELAEMVGSLGQEWDVPVIVSIRDLWPDVFFTLLPGPLQGLGPLLFSGWKARAKRACSLATSIVGISPGYLNWGLSCAGRSKGLNDVLIPLGYPDRVPADSSKIKQAQVQLESRGVDFSRTLISFIGTFGRSYDLSTVIDAAKILATKCNVQFVLCGEGDRATNWKAEAKDIPNVVFPGWVDQLQIATLLDASSLGLAAYAPGAKQGLPNKLFEYMSFGVPIISSLGGEAAIEIKNHRLGRSYLAGNGVDLAEVLIAVLADSARLTQMATAARERFESTYRQSVVYERYVDLIEQLAGGDTCRKIDLKSHTAISIPESLKENHDV